tara:strand:- start:166 stop:477 length:312 start_codon:yes stop_codon:yes gene_type:complete
MKNPYLQVKSIAQVASVFALVAASIFAVAADLTNGVIKRVDVENGKVTIKHEEILNLDMPGMTMVFYLKDKTATGRFVPGDAIKFSVVMEGDKMVITEIEKAK